MTLLIADDEDLIRFTIKDMVRDSGLYFDRIMEATSGSELISLCRRQPPDIALVDIRMPGKSGLDAMKELQDLPTQWIILTGHADFAYAQKAIKLGADDYLLKPPSPDEIRQALTSALGRTSELKREILGDFERRILSVFDNTNAPEYDPLFSEQGVWSGSVLCLDSSLTQKETLQLQTAYAHAVREEYFPCLPIRCRAALTTLEDGKLLLTSFRSSPGEGIAEREGDIPVPQETKGFRFYRIRIEEADDYTSYIRSLNRLKSRFPLRFLMEEKEIREQEASDDRLLCFCRNIEEMILNAGAFRRQEIETLMEDLLGTEVPLSKGQEAVLRETLITFFPGHEQSKGYREILESLRRENRGERNDGQSVLVQQALRIIRDKYNEDIGIAQIAYTLQVTPNYLSALFRKQTGKPFTRYITEIRMNVSRQLLKATNLNIKEIAAKVGYNSSRHFAALFRQETGMSPTEYIKRYRS